MNESNSAGFRQRQTQKKLQQTICPPVTPPIVNKKKTTKKTRRPTTPKTTAAKNTAAAKPDKPDPSKPATRSQRRQARQLDKQAKQKNTRQRQKQQQRTQAAEKVVVEAQAQLDAQEKMATLPICNTHAAGIDVGDETHWVCIESTPDGSDNVREFSAMTCGLKDLVAWLKSCGVTTVALEATGVYSHILFLTLLEEGFQTLMVPAQFCKQIKGRPKTDKRDCQWIQRLHKLGLLPAVFQPDEATQTLRDLVRQRANHVRLSSHHIQRMQKALALMNVKLTKVLGDITGVTGLKIIRAILKGERDPVKLARLRDPRCKHSEAQIAKALEGRYRPEHVLELKLCLKMWEQYQEIIRTLDRAIEDQLEKMRSRSKLPPLPPRTRKRGRKPHDPHFDARTALYYMTGLDVTDIDGIDELNALVILSEIGTDMSKWPTVKHFCSWLGLCPNWKKTGGKVKSSKSRRRKNRAATALRLAAFSLMRSKGYLGAYIRRQRMRLGAPKAITATAHKLARILYNMLRFGVAYAKKTEAEYAAQVRERQLKNLKRQARALGYQLQEIAPTVATSEPVASESPIAAAEQTSNQQPAGVQGG